VIAPKTTYRSRIPAGNSQRRPGHRVASRSPPFARREQYPGRGPSVALPGIVLDGIAPQADTRGLDPRRTTFLTAFAKALPLCAADPLLALVSLATRPLALPWQRERKVGLAASARARSSEAAPKSRIDERMDQRSRAGEGFGSHKHSKVFNRALPGCNQAIPGHS
jgi:hypothetical protein